MTIQTTYTQARDGLAKLLDQVTHNRELVIIQRHKYSPWLNYIFPPKDVPIR